jgi:hypothetical protein
MTEEIVDGDDYADWIRWVSDAEKGIRSVHESTHDVHVPLLLQQHSLEHDSAIPMLLQTIQVQNSDSDCKPTEKFASSPILSWGLGGRRSMNESKSTPI